MLIRTHANSLNTVFHDENEITTQVKNIEYGILNSTLIYSQHNRFSEEFHFHVNFTIHVYKYMVM